MKQRQHDEPRRWGWRGCHVQVEATTGGSSWKICVDSGWQEDESELAEASDVALDFRCSRCGSECSEDLDEEEGRIA